MPPALTPLRSKTYAFPKTPLLGGVSEGRGGLQKNYKSPLRLCETPPLVRGGAFDVAQLKCVTMPLSRAWLKAPLLGGVSEGRGGLHEKLQITPPSLRDTSPCQGRSF